MPMRRLSLVVAAVALVAACGRADKAADSAAAHDSVGVANATGGGTAGTSSLTSASPTGDPPPPPIDDTGSVYLTGAAATTSDDSAAVRFQYDTVGTTGYKATFSALDSTTVGANTTLTSSGSTITGTGRITAKGRSGTIDIDLSRGIAAGGSLGKCVASAPGGPRNCGSVTFDSAQFTPRNGRPTTRRVRLVLGG